MTQGRQMMNCGMFELHGLLAESDGGPKKFLLERWQIICNRYAPQGRFDEQGNYVVDGEFSGPAYAICVFTDYVKQGRGEKFATFIRDNELGDLYEGPRAHNFNTEREVKLWVWKVDHKALKEWGRVNSPPKPVKVIKDKTPIRDPRSGQVQGNQPKARYPWRRINNF